jgi:acetyl/propionyl-CoA carboxylase alpha subunit
MKIRRVLVANRGEIAVRVMRTLADLGIESVGVHPDDDAGSLHVRRADVAVRLPGTGPAAYLDIDAVVDAARRSDCQAVHPGYGFLAENAAFATAVEAAGLIFVGPTPETLALFGDKVAARRHAQAVGVPVARGVALPDAAESDGAGDDGDDGRSPAEAAVAAAMGLLTELGPGAALMIKAAAGGGGRGMRIVAPAGAANAAADSTATADLLAEAVARCASEARTAFGDGALYAEELLLGARHIEVQVVGDGTDVAALGERECSIQRQRQKLVEMAPAPGLHPDTRARLVRHALDLVAPVGLRSLATMEFLVVGADTAEATIVFCEGNARIQVEHTVTEEVFGVDLVEAQIRLADGARLADLGLPDAPNGTAVQARLNLERLEVDGSIRPAGGTLDPLVFPTGHGIRVDTGVAAGDTTNPRYDTLAAKVIAHHRSDDPRRALARLAAALAETSTGAVDSTAALIGAIVARDEVATGQVHTRWLDENLADLVAGLAADHPAAERPASDGGATPVPGDGIAGARVDRNDPLAVLAHGRDAALATAVVGRVAGATGPASAGATGEGVVTASAPMQGTVVSIEVEIGDPVAAGTTVAVMEAMKMEHVVVAPEPGTVTAVLVEAGTAVFEGHPLVAIAPAVVRSCARVTPPSSGSPISTSSAPTSPRPSNATRSASTSGGPTAVARRRRTGQRTARVLRLHGAGRHPGLQNHRKKDRLFELAERQRLPVVFFTEGGGGPAGRHRRHRRRRPRLPGLPLFGELSGLVPLVGIAAGAASPATPRSSAAATWSSPPRLQHRHGRPGDDRGRRARRVPPEEVGPIDVTRSPTASSTSPWPTRPRRSRSPSSTCPTSRARLGDWDCADQRGCATRSPRTAAGLRRARGHRDPGRHRLGARAAPGFGLGMVTALARIEGRPVGVIANDPPTSPAPSTATPPTRPPASCSCATPSTCPSCSCATRPGSWSAPTPRDRPGAPRQPAVRHRRQPHRARSAPSCCARATASAPRPWPAAASTPRCSPVGWPTGEFGGMGLEGAVKLGYRNELAAIEDPTERRRTFDEMVERMYEHGKGTRWPTTSRSTTSSTRPTPAAG